MPEIQTVKQCCYFVVVTILSLGLLQQCGGKMPPEYRELFSLSSSEREARFKQLPIDKQVDVFIYAMYVEPPMTEFQRYLAGNKEKAIPFIITRLEVEKSDTAKANLIYVLKEMHEYHFSLKHEEATKASLQRIIDNMTYEYDKNRATEYMQVIKNTPGFNN